MKILSYLLFCTAISFAQSDLKNNNDIADASNSVNEKVEEKKVSSKKYKSGLILVSSTIIKTKYPQGAFEGLREDLFTEIRTKEEIK